MTKAKFVPIVVVGSVRSGKLLRAMGLQRLEIFMGNAFMAVFDDYRQQLLTEIVIWYGDKN